MSENKNNKQSQIGYRYSDKKNKFERYIHGTCTRTIYENYYLITINGNKFVFFAFAYTNQIKITHNRKKT